MKAVVMYAPGQGNVEFLDGEEVPCGHNDVRSNGAHCRVCSTDTHVLQDALRNYPPVILAHGSSGTVVEVGKDLRSVQRSDWVAWVPATPVEPLSEKQRKPDPDGSVRGDR